MFDNIKFANNTNIVQNFVKMYHNSWEANHFGLNCASCRCVSTCWMPFDAAMTQHFYGILK